MKKMLALMMAVVMAGSMLAVPQTVKAEPDLIPVEGEELEAGSASHVSRYYIQPITDRALLIDCSDVLPTELYYSYTLADGEDEENFWGEMPLSNFRSSDTDIASIEDLGDGPELMANAVGCATITADYTAPEALQGILSNTTVSFKVYVTEYNVETMVFTNASKFTVSPGETMELYLQMAGMDPEGEPVGQDELSGMTISWNPMTPAAYTSVTLTVDSADAAHATMKVKSSASYEDGEIYYQVCISDADGQVIAMHDLYYSIYDESEGIRVNNYNSAEWKIGDTRSVNLDLVSYGPADSGAAVPNGLKDAVILDHDGSQVPFMVNADGSITVTVTRHTTSAGSLNITLNADTDDEVTYYVDLYPGINYLYNSLSFLEETMEAAPGTVDVIISDAAFKQIPLPLNYVITGLYMGEDGMYDQEIDLASEVISSDTDSQKTVLRVTLPDEYSSLPDMILTVIGEGEWESFWGSNVVYVYNPEYGVQRESQMIRVAGQNRYTTAVESANALKEVLGIEKFDNIVLASGEDFPDALAGGPLATELEAPILLVSKKSATVALNYVYNNLKAGGNVYLLGGTFAVPQAVEDTLNSKGYHVERVAGANRYGTDAAIVRKMIEVTAANAIEEDMASINSVCVVQAMGYADSLSVSGAAGAYNMPIILAPKDGLTTEQANLIKQIAPENIYIIGGTVAVTDKTETILKNLAAGIEGCSVERIAGANRFGTSIAIAQYFDMQTSESAILAYAMNFPDGLTGGVLAGTLGAPVILVSDKGYRPAANFFAREDCYTEYYYAVGGTYVIPDPTVEQIMKKW